MSAAEALERLRATIVAAAAEHGQPPAEAAMFAALFDLLGTGAVNLERIAAALEKAALEKIAERPR